MVFPTVTCMLSLTVGLSQRLLCSQDHDSHAVWCIWLFLRSRHPCVNLERTQVSSGPVGPPFQFQAAYSEGAHDCQSHRGSLGRIPGDQVPEWPFSLSNTKISVLSRIIHLLISRFLKFTFHVWMHTNQRVSSGFESKALSPNFPFLRAACFSSFSLLFWCWILYF